MNPEDKEKLELDKELLTPDQFYVEYGYYPDEENFDWQSPLEWGNN